MLYPGWATNLDFQVVGDVVSAFGCYPRLQLFWILWENAWSFHSTLHCILVGYFFSPLEMLYWFSSMEYGNLGYIQTHPSFNSIHDCLLWMLMLSSLFSFEYQVCEWEVSQLVEINEGVLQCHSFCRSGRSKFLFLIQLCQQICFLNCTISAKWNSIQSCDLQFFLDCI